MANNVQRLPSTSFIIKDGGLTPQITGSSTYTLTIIGNAVDGPVNVPVPVRSLQEAEDIFGPISFTKGYKNPNNNTEDKLYSGNSLLKSMYEAQLSGAGSIALVRVGGTQAYSLNKLDLNLSFYGKYNGKIYNGVQIVSTSGASGYMFNIIQPTRKGGNFTLEIDSSKKVRDFLEALNTDYRNNSVIVTVLASALDTAITSLGVGTVTLTGGTNGTSVPGDDYASSKENYYTALTESYGTFDSLVDLNTDIVLLTGVYADDKVSSSAATTTTVVQEFGEFLYDVSKESKPCIGLIGLRPNGTRTPAEASTFITNNYLSTSAGYVNQAAGWIKFGYFMNAGFTYSDVDTGEVVDIGGLVSVVAGPDAVYTNKELGYYTDNPVASYAGLLSALPPHVGATNKIVGGIVSLGANYPKVSHQLLRQGLGFSDQAGNKGKGAYVSLTADRATGKPKVIDDVTAADRTSDFSTLQTRRIVVEATSRAKAVLDPFIGEPNNSDTKAAMKTRLTSTLQEMVDAGMLFGGDGNGFRFAITASNNLDLHGIDVLLQIRPAFEIKWITVKVNVSR